MKCEHCKEELSWCDCPRQCRKGNHMWDDKSERCKGCKIPKEAVMKSTTMPNEEQKDKGFWECFHKIKKQLENEEAEISDMALGRLASLMNQEIEAASRRASLQAREERLSKVKSVIESLKTEFWIEKDDYQKGFKDGWHEAREDVISILEFLK